MLKVGTMLHCLRTEKSFSLREDGKKDVFSPSNHIFYVAMSIQMSITSFFFLMKNDLDFFGQIVQPYIRPEVSFDKKLNWSVEERWTVAVMWGGGKTALHPRGDELTA